MSETLLAASGSAYRFHRCNTLLGRWRPFRLGKETTEEAFVFLDLHIEVLVVVDRFLRVNSGRLGADFRGKQKRTTRKKILHTAAEKQFDQNGVNLTEAAGSHL